MPSERPMPTGWKIFAARAGVRVSLPRRCSDTPLVRCSLKTECSDKQRLWVLPCATLAGTQPERPQLAKLNGLPNGPDANRDTHPPACLLRIFDCLAFHSLPGRLRRVPCHVLHRNRSPTGRAVDRVRTDGTKILDLIETNEVDGLVTY